MSVDLEREKILRKALFIPCETKEHLHRWIKIFLGIDVPNAIVCDDDERNPPSNSSPMDLIWEMYSKARSGEDSGFTQVLGFAARDSFKTLSSAIMETLCLFHLNRNVGHMAALEAQARNCQRYILGYLKRPILREFVTADNKRLIEVTRYQHTKTKDVISPIQFNSLPLSEKGDYEEFVNWMKIVMATVEDCNGLHVPFFTCVDENSDILVKNYSNKNKRDRVSAKARGIYNRLFGVYPTKGLEFESFITKPKQKIEVLSFNENNGILEFKEITKASRTFQERFELELSSGKKIIATSNHLVKTPEGYKKIADLKIGDSVLGTGRSKSLNTVSIESKNTCQLVNRSTLKKVEILNKKSLGKGWVVDFTVKDNHNFFVNGVLVHNCDELDLADPAAFEESKMIPCMTEDGKMPITFLTSTRKYSFGLVQKEIDNAQNSGMHVRHWNIIDVTKTCPPSRHLPKEPKIPIYYSEQKLRSISEADWKILSEKEREQYDVKIGYKGCLDNCRLFAQCKGRLTSKQTSDSPLLKPIEMVQALFQKVSTDHAKAQLLCFAKDTDILLSDGSVKKISDIFIGDSVITHKGNSRKVTEIFQRPFSGYLKSIVHNPWKLTKETLVTSEHPYFINGVEFKEVGKIKKSSIKKEIRIPEDFISLPSSYEENKIQYIKYTDFVNRDVKIENDRVTIKNKTSSSRSIPLNIKIDEEFGWILGFFLAEGNFRKRTFSINTEPYYQAIVFNSHIKENEYHEKIRLFFKKLGLSTAEVRPKNKNCLIQVINGATIAELFYELCGEYSYAKKINSKIFNFNKDFLSGILNGFWCGDGSKTVNSQYELVSVNKTLITQLFTIASRFGLNPRVKIKNKVMDRRDVYLLYFDNKSHKYKINRTKYKFDNFYNQARIDNIQEVFYEGDVFNIEVEDDHSYIANGAAVHNCWKPSSEGLVYPFFSREKHLITPSQMAQKAFGEEYPPSLSKSELIYLFKEAGAQFYSGLDWGFTHNFAVMTAALLGHTLYVIDIISARGLELHQKIALCKEKIMPLQSTIYPDSAYPSDILSFRKAGFKMVKFQKDVQAGVEGVRLRLNPGDGAMPSIYFIKDDPGCEDLASKILQYHWKVDPQGNLTDDLDKTVDDDILDSMRYLCQNVPINKSKAILNISADKVRPGYTQKNWMEEKIRELTSDGDDTIQISGKPGGFLFSI